ncbi:hypothetical protein PPH41_05200, partial [Burkholderia gladioli]|nr:hypothetical protein [Burkholderia gladioli]
LDEALLAQFVRDDPVRAVSHAGEGACIHRLDGTRIRTSVVDDRNPQARLKPSATSPAYWAGADG